MHRNLTYKHQLQLTATCSTGLPLHLTSRRTLSRSSGVNSRFFLIILTATFIPVATATPKLTSANEPAPTFFPSITYLSSKFSPVIQYQ
jgi:hypothetical protein